MAIRVIRSSEGDETRDWRNAVTEYGVKYLVLGAPDKPSALDAVYAEAPAQLGDLRYSGCRFDGYAGDGGIEVTAEYRKMSRIFGMDEYGVRRETMSFDCSGGSIKRLRRLDPPDELVELAKHDRDAAKALANWITRRYPATAPDSAGFIGWNGKDGDLSQIDGVEVVTATMRETWTRAIRMGDLTVAFRRKLAKLTGKVNHAPFKGWEAGEVLFLGASFSGEDDRGELVGVTYNFAIQPNEKKAEIEGSFADPSLTKIEIEDKKGWQYIWSISETKIVNQVPKLLIAGVYVDTVYAEADFGELGLEK